MLDSSFSATVDGIEKIFDIKATTVNDQREAQKIYNQTFSDAVKSGSIVRARLDDLLKQQGLWDDNKDIEFATLQQEILENEKKLAKGGISLKSARALAIHLKNLRLKMRDLIAAKTNLDSHTAEGQADNARFNYLVSVCVVYKDTKQPYFKDYNDYLNRATDIVGLLGAQKLASMMYGLDSDFEKKLPENKFLIKYKLVNSDLEYVDDKGRLIDEEGRLIDKNGRYISENGEFVDKDGNPVDQKGDYSFEFQPFLDDNGNPIQVENDQSTTSEKSQDTQASN